MYVSLAAPASGGALLPQVLPALQQRYPALTAEVDFDDRVIDLVRDGYDLALRGGQIVDSALVSRPICRLPMALVASPDYLPAPECLIRPRRCGHTA